MKTAAFRAPQKGGLKLDDFDPGATPSIADKDEGRSVLAAQVERLVKLQDVFAAARTRACLLVFQGMDTSGKDSTVKHVFSGVNPAGVDAFSFKSPTDEEVSHDFLWRSSRVLPARGRIAVFNRSYYEEVVVVRVHPDMLEREAAAPAKHLWEDRFAAINAFEEHLTRNGTLILKFFLHVSRREQRKRLLARLDDPSKQWKFEAGDLRERRLWGDYRSAYEKAIGATSTACAPWYIIPADHQWFARAAVASIVADQLDALGLRYPKLSPDVAGRLADLRRDLDAE